MAKAPAPPLPRYFKSPRVRWSRLVSRMQSILQEQPKTGGAGAEVRLWAFEQILDLPATPIDVSGRCLLRGDPDEFMRRVDQLFRFVWHGTVPVGAGHNSSSVAGVAAATVGGAGGGDNVAARVEDRAP